MIIHKPLMPSVVIIYQISFLSEIKMVPLDAADTICLMACMCVYEFLRYEQEGAVQRSTDFHLCIRCSQYQIISIRVFYVINRTALGMQLPE